MRQAAGMPAAPKKPKVTKPKVEKPTTRFHERLVLPRFLLGEFGLSAWDRVRELLREAEGSADANGVPDFLPVVGAFERGRLGKGTLAGYDAAIRGYWKAITDGRRAGGKRPRLLYFQYLALLCSHRYLERLFYDRAGLLTDLNAEIERWNAATRPRRPSEPLHRRRTEQTGVLECDRERQNAADARSSVAISGFSKVSPSREVERRTRAA